MIAKWKMYPYRCADSSQSVVPKLFSIGAAMPQVHVLQPAVGNGVNHRVQLFHWYSLVKCL